MAKRNKFRKAAQPSKTPLDAATRLQAYSPPGRDTIMGAGPPIEPTWPQPVRMFDYQVGQNRVYTPRSSEAWTFSQIRSFSNCEIVRLAIETRKDQIEALSWQVRPIRGKDSADDIDHVKAVEKYMRYPDGQNDFASWSRLIVEDLLSIDAPAIERVRTRGGKIAAHDVIDGATIKVLIDDTGRRPRGPKQVAFQQIIKGRVWNNLTNEDLLYVPRNIRPGHVYGYSPVEQIIVTINTLLRRQQGQLAHFTEGNIPAGLLNAPASWNPDQIELYQRWLDARLSGQFDQQARMIVAPEGVDFQALKPPPLKDEFDEWLARVVMYAFSLPPSPYVRQLNRSTSDTDADRAKEEGLKPLKLWFKRLIDRIVQEDLGYENLEFTWIEGLQIDPRVQADIDDKALRNATATIDEVRLSRGKDPLPDGLGASPLVYTAQGVIPLATLVNSAGAVVPLPPAAANGTSSVSEDAALAPKPQASPQAAKPTSAAEDASQTAPAQ